MWKIFNRITKHGITPNQCFILFCLKEKISAKGIDNSDVEFLVSENYITKTNTSYKISDKAKNIISDLEKYHKKYSKQNDVSIMGEDYDAKIKEYRLLFPKGKLPSGKPARCNVKTLAENFRWFFNFYDYSWDEVLKATSMYVKGYRDNEFLYMKTSQYFISKQDKHKIKHSELADYCDMIRDGVVEKTNPFKDKVV